MGSRSDYPARPIKPIAAAADDSSLAGSAIPLRSAPAILLLTRSARSLRGSRTCRGARQGLNHSCPPSPQEKRPAITASLRWGDGGQEWIILQAPRRSPMKATRLPGLQALRSRSGAPRLRHPLMLTRSRSFAQWQSNCVLIQPSIFPAPRRGAENGQGWIRTSEGIASRFPVCPV